MPASRRKITAKATTPGGVPATRDIDYHKQVVAGPLSIEPGSSVEFSDASVTNPGVYTLFDYSASSFTQAATYTPADLTVVPPYGYTVDPAGPTHDAAAKKIVVRLNYVTRVRKAPYTTPCELGVQQVIGAPLVLEPGATVVLDRTVVDRAGTYVLFRYTALDLAGAIDVAAVLTVQVPTGFRAATPTATSEEIRVQITEN